MTSTKAAQFTELDAHNPQLKQWVLCERAGAQGRNRTTDTRIFSPLLYQLSYLGFSPVTMVVWAGLARGRPPGKAGGL